MGSSGYYIVILIIAVLFILYLYSKKCKKYDLLDLQKSALNINKNISDIIGSTTMIIQSGNSDPTIMQFINDSQRHYQSNVDSIAAIDQIIQQLQGAPEEIISIIDLRLANTNRSKMYRGEFSNNDTAEQIVGATTGVADYLVSNNADFLLKSKDMTDYLKTYVDGSPGFKGVSNNITTLRNNLSNAVSQIDSLLTGLSTGTLSIKWAAGKSVKCSGYNPKGDGAIYRYDGSKLQYYPSINIATTWDPNWARAMSFDCTGVPLGDNAISNIPANASIKCTGFNPKGDGAVYRYDGGKLRWYQNRQIATTWDYNWLNNLTTYDCTGIPAGDDMSIKYVPTPKLKQVSIDGNRVCGINLDGNIYCKDDLTSANWYIIPGTAKHISINGNNGYVVGTNDQLYYTSDITKPGWTNQSLPGSSTAIKKVDVDGNRVCVIPTDRSIWCKDGLTGNSWYQLLGALDHISISGNTAYGNTADGAIFYNNNVGGKQDWIRIGGVLTQVDMSGNNVCGVNSSNEIFCKTDLTSANWKPIEGRLTNISISGNNTYGVNSTNDVFYAPFNSSSWTKI